MAESCFSKIAGFQSETALQKDSITDGLTIHKMVRLQKSCTICEGIATLKISVSYACKPVTNVLFQAPSYDLFKLD